MGASKKKRPNRPPRQVWLCLWPDGKLVGPFRTRGEIAAPDENERPYRIVGPYVLAERVSER